MFYIYSLYSSTYTYYTLFARALEESPREMRKMLETLVVCNELELKCKFDTVHVQQHTHTHTRKYHHK